MSLRIVFMGTPEFAVPSLAEIIANSYDVVRVYTQPPRASGRGKKITKSPVHQFAEIMGIPVEIPEKFNECVVLDELEALEADVCCVVAYGQILPKRALESTKYGCLNLHASLLPRWRGAAPIHRAIMAGDEQTGVQIQKMKESLDTGDILLSELIKIKDTDTTGSLFQSVSRIGASMWPRVLGAIEREGLSLHKQEGKPTYAHKIKKTESRINWDLPAVIIDRHIRGLSPFPGAWCKINGERVKIHMSKYENFKNLENVQPGTVIEEGLLIACKENAVRLVEVQPAGKSKMNVREFLKGRKVPLNTELK